MKNFKASAIAVAIGLLLIILLQNTEPVETRILFLSFVMPRAALLFFTALLGFSCGVVLMMILNRQERQSRRNA